MAADRLSYRTIATRVPGWLQLRVASLSEPANSRRLRWLLVALFSVWVLVALAQLIWALFPQAGSRPVSGQIINPPVLSAGSGGAGAAQVDIDALRSWPLFGEPGAAVTAEPEAELAAASVEREGIEKGARETRLDLVLRGIIAFSADGAGSAIIEHRGQQAVYAVDDTLPASGRVTLAKVMPSQVVLDNGGTYELLLLYQPSALDAQLTGVRLEESARARIARPAVAVVQVVDKRADADATALASDYRDQLYRDPQSLAELVRIAAVRDGGELQGYRLTPGRDREQFEKLGFRSGDLVVAVNGMPLSDPANTMRLYQAMRSASEASFELLRGGEAVAVNVSLGAATGEQW
ncbi:type II secretion system protein GspC [Haliea sp.]